MKVRYNEVSKGRDIMKLTVSVIQNSGKRDLSYRGHRDESTYTLQNEQADHGIYLEILLLQTKYDNCLRKHINDCIDKILHKVNL